MLETLVDLKLEERHIRALSWFYEHAEREVGWPITLDAETLLANKAKGVYKPVWSDYALSVKQTLGGPYADKEPIWAADGSWTYLYYQAEQPGKDAQDLSSNRALRKCMEDGVPVGVLRQLRPKPSVCYKVLGLARVVGWAGGYFLLSGDSKDQRPVRGLSQADIYSSVERTLTVTDGIDLRTRRLQSVVQRQGQPKFRANLMRLYDQKCAITGCDVPEVLEAAHVVPYRGAHTNDVSNGLILRADLHTLFDAGLLSVDAESLRARFSPQLTNHNYYGKYSDLSLHIGARSLDKELLRVHQHYCGY